MEKITLFESFLNAGKPEQMAAYRDDNPVMKEVLKAFNKTVQTQVNGYSAHTAMLISNDQECDRLAKEKADAIMKKAFEETVTCLVTFRQRIRSEVETNITDIRDVPQDKRASLILPIDECFEKYKKDTFEMFGHNTAEHLICSKKIKQTKAKN